MLPAKNTYSDILVHMLITAWVWAFSFTLLFSTGYYLYRQKDLSADETNYVEEGNSFSSSGANIKYDGNSSSHYGISYYDNSSDYFLSSDLNAFNVTSNRFNHFYEETIHYSLLIFLITFVFVIIIMSIYYIALGKDNIKPVYNSSFNKYMKLCWVISITLMFPLVNNAIDNKMVKLRWKFIKNIKKTCEELGSDNFIEVFKSSSQNIQYNQHSIPVRHNSQDKNFAETIKKDWENTWGDISSLYEITQSNWELIILSKNGDTEFGEYVIRPYAVGYKKLPYSYFDFKLSYPSIEGALNIALSFCEERNFSNFKFYKTQKEFKQCPIGYVNSEFDSENEYYVWESKSDAYSGNFNPLFDDYNKTNSSKLRSFGWMENGWFRVYFSIEKVGKWYQRMIKPNIDKHDKIRNWTIGVMLLSLIFLVPTLFTKK